MHKAGNPQAIPTDSPAPIGLSVAIVCKNNEETIGRTLESVRGLADEIVAVDSGSTDRTLDILEEHGARIIKSDWLGHIRTKQKALDACALPWIIHLDSDESLEPALRKNVRDAVVRNDKGIAGYEVNRKIWWKGAFLEHAWQPEWRLRLVRKDRARWGGRDPHDALELLPGESTGRTARLAGDLRHDSFVSMTDHLRAQVSHSSVGARSAAEAGSTPSRLRIVASPTGAFMKQMIMKSAWRDGWRGWCAAGSVAAATLMKHIISLEQAHADDEEVGNDRDKAPEQ